MTAINAEMTVAELVVDHPTRTRILEKLGIDFCCGGHKSLAEACAAKGLDPNTVVQTLNAFEALEPVEHDQQDWSKASLTSLIDHIVSTHHDFLREEMPRLNFLAEKVSQVHGPRHPNLYEVRSVYEGLYEELDSHLDKEEEVLFPVIRSLEAGGVDAQKMAVAAPIQVMGAEHDSAGRALAKLRELTDNYTTPADGCSSYRALMEGLLEMEQDLHQHIHLENNILFPRALALQQGA